MKIIRGITEFVMKLRGATKLDIELSRLRERIAEGDFELEDMDHEWARSGGVCCPGCMYGRKYHDLCDKQDRRRKIEKDLIRKIGG
jgi:hypothetical protein